MENINPYENEKLKDMPDGILRPGGVELTERLVSLAGLAPGARILDIGCGLGGSAIFLADRGFDVTGVDKSRVLIERGKELSRQARLFEANAENLPFEDTSFDAALFECSLSLMDADAALAEAMRVLKPGGALLISDVFYNTEEGFRELLRRSGFENITFEDKTFVFKEFIAQLIMSTGSVDALFDCAEWERIKKAKPGYCLVTAQKRV